MTNEEKKNYLLEIKKRYELSGKVEKGKLLDQATQTLDMNRKSLIRALAHLGEGIERRHGRPSVYHSTDLARHVEYLWRMLGCPGTSRFSAMLSLWLPYYLPNIQSTESKSLLTKVSGPTLQRLLKRLDLKGNRKADLLESHIWNSMWLPRFLKQTILGSVFVKIFPFGVANEEDTLYALFACERKTRWHNIQIIKASEIFRFDYYLVDLLRNFPMPIYELKMIHPRSHSSFQVNTFKSVDQANEYVQKRYLPLTNYFDARFVKRGSKGDRDDKPKTPFQRVLEEDSISDERKKQLAKQFQGLNPIELLNSRLEISSP